MTAMIRELAFDLRDLRQVSIECRHCRTKVLLDLEAFDRTGHKREGERATFAPTNCPACEEQYDSAMESLNDLQAAYKKLAKIEASGLQFRVTAQTEKAEA